MSTRPIYADPWRDPDTFVHIHDPLPAPTISDQGKSDPYHTELSHADLLHLELLKYARTHPGMFTADDLIAIIEALEA